MKLDYLEPNHEGVMIVLEAKETVALQHVFGNDAVHQNHQFADLDRVLWEELGTRLYTPREFLSRCARKSDGSAPSLIDCAASQGWPTVDEMRGRYMVSIIGNWARNYFDWLDYANSGIESRAAFPMRSMLSPDLNALQYAGTIDLIDLHVASGDRGEQLVAPGQRQPASLPFGDPTFQPRLKNARKQSIVLGRASVFMDPNQNQAKIDGRAMLEAGVMMRSGDAFTFNRRIDGNGNDTNDSYGQYHIVVNYNSPGVPAASTLPPLGMQFIQTDFPSYFISDDYQTTNNGPNYLRAFFQRSDIVPALGNSYPAPLASGQTSTTTTFDTAALSEPGRRIYIGSPYQRVATATMATPDGNDFWEMQATGSMDPHDGRIDLQGDFAGGRGCLSATSSTDATAQFMICRQADTDGRRTVHLTVTSTSAGKTTTNSYDMPHFDPEPNSIGDLVRLQITHAPGASTVHVWTAGFIDPTNVPHWNELTGVSGRQIAADLDVQGIAGDTSILFSGLKHGASVPRMLPVNLSDLPQRTFPEYIHDESYCPGNACEVSHVPNRSQTVTSWDGGTYVKVYEMFGHVFGGQPRHFYTTDPLEATTSGLNEQVTEAKFLLRVDQPDASWIPVFRCVDLKKDVHAYWLSTNPACTNSGDSPGTVQDVLGFASATARANMQPLLHGRIATSNSTGWHNGLYNGDEHDTHDHLFGPNGSNFQGYTIRDDSADGRPWVYTLTSGTTPPCVPVRTACSPGHCIQQDNGCGAMIQCGACGTGTVCSDTTMLCVGQDTKAACQAECQDLLDCGLLKSQCVQAYNKCMAACH